MAVIQKESSIQKACVAWFRMQYKDLVLFAIPNEAKRSFALAKHMKALGLSSGVPDLFLAQPNFTSCGMFTHHGLFIEMKSSKGKLTDNQKAMADNLKAAGYKVETCRTLDEFMGVVKNYLYHETGKP